jgi:hypothetical protein
VKFGSQFPRREDGILNREEASMKNTIAVHGYLPIARGKVGAFMYHVTTPERAPVILREGFRDHAARKGFGNMTTYMFDSGVWFADVPPITAISVDQWLGHKDEAWIAIFITETDFGRIFQGNEWQDESWPTRQWLIPANCANQFERSEVPLEQVLRLRIVNNTTEHHAYYTADILREQITQEMGGAVQGRWLAALDEATYKLRA